MSPHALDLFDTQSGSALVEFALCVPVLVLVFMGVVDYGLMLQQEMQISQAAAAGAAYGAIPGNQEDFTGMQTAAQNAAPGVSGFAAVATDVYTCTPGGAAVVSTATCSGYGTPIEYVQLRTSATVPPLLAYSGISSLPLSGKALYRVQWTSP